MMTANTSGPVCDASAPLIGAEEAADRIALDAPEWTLAEDGLSISRELKVKGFAKATYLTGLAVWLADKTGHHPDMQLGWGYFRLSYTTHEAGGLTEVDFACAQRFDRALES
jgi:4a-hydroxytetrahydrobiopterin dehydratase